MITLSEYPRSTVAFTTKSGFTSFMVPSKSRKSAGRRLMTLPVQSLPFEMGAAEISDCMEYSCSGLSDDLLADACGRFRFRKSRKLEHGPDFHRTLLSTGNACGDADS